MKFMFFILLFITSNIQAQSLQLIKAELHSGYGVENTKKCRNYLYRISYRTIKDIETIEVIQNNLKLSRNDFSIYEVKKLENVESNQIIEILLRENIYSNKTSQNSIKKRTLPTSIKIELKINGIIEQYKIKQKEIRVVLFQ